MTGDLALTLALLGLTVVLFARGRPRMDAVALMMLTLLPILGLVSLDEALAGFSDPNILLIAVLFVVGEALVRTGVAQALGDRLSRLGRGSELRLIVLLMALVAGIGAFMSSTGVVALFIPITLRIAAQNGIAPGRLMMPLSVAALISGMLTLVATAPNLVLNSLLQRQGHAGFGFFSFTPFGLPILLGAILYMLAARRFLARDAAPPPPGRPSLVDWIARYRLEGRAHRLQVGPGADWAGRRLADLHLRASEGITILGIERGRGLARRLIQPTAATEIRLQDVLLLDLGPGAGSEEGAGLGSGAGQGTGPEAAAMPCLPPPTAKNALAAPQDRALVALDAAPPQGLRPLGLQRLALQHPGLQPLALEGGHFADRAQEIGMAELLVAPETALVGQSLKGAAFRSRHGVAVLGLRREGGALEGPITDLPLRAGDVLLAVGPWKALRQLAKGREVILLDLPAEEAQVVARPGRVLPVLAVVAGMVALMVGGPVSALQAALLAALALGALGAVDMAHAYRAIHWQSLLLIVGMLPFSIALERSGGVALAAEALGALTAGTGPLLALAALFVLTAVLGLFISNTATAVLVGPVALRLAADLGVSPYPFMMGVALAASAAFMTPVSSPVNTLVVGPGGYRFGDFLRLGLPLMAVPLAVTLGLVPLLLPF